MINTSRRFSSLYGEAGEKKINWSGSGAVSVEEAEEFYKELGKVIKEVKEFNKRITI